MEQNNPVQQTHHVAGNPSTPLGVQQREVEFHDRWANDSRAEEVLVYESFESPLAPENHMALKLMGDIRGKNVLDIAAGLGESAVYFALQGAEVTAVDISPEMILQTKKLAALHNVQVATSVCPIEVLDLPDNEFDVCYAANVLHHVIDKKVALREISRVLKPNGLVITWDPLAYNPIINVYRRMATAVRTADEKPLTFEFIDEFKEIFEQVDFRVFWLTSLLVFIKYYIVDRVHPNDDRYWKRILKEKPTLYFDLVASTHCTRSVSVTFLPVSVLGMVNRGPWSKLGLDLIEVVRNFNVPIPRCPFLHSIPALSLSVLVSHLFGSLEEGNLDEYTLLSVRLVS